MTVFRTRPVRRYRVPVYPRAGYEIPSSVHRSFWQRGSRALLVASFFPALSACDLEDEMVGGRRGPSAYLSESKARTIVLEEISSRLQLEQEVPFAKDEVSFTADGYDDQLQVGYEFISDDWEEQNDLDRKEQTTLREWKEQSGPYFLIIDPNFDFVVGSRTEAENVLREEVRTFITFLEGQGVL